MKKFFANLKEIAENLPMVLSDTYSAKDVSANRIAFFALLISVLGLVEAMKATPSLAGPLLPVLQSLLATLGIQQGVNMIKRTIDAWKQKTAGQAPANGGQTNATSQSSGHSDNG